MRRGWIAVGVGGLLLGAIALVGPPTQAATQAPTTSAAAAVASWQQRWAPEASVDGLGAFEGVEDDRADSHPAGQPHILAQGDNYRFNMHLVDRDSSTDRQRQEVKGMRTGGQDLILLKGETWKFTQSMFIPGSLKATTTFTHIMQLKMPGTDSLPILTMSLQRVNNVPKIQLHVFEGDVIVGATDLAPLQNKWIDLELEMTIGDGSNGKLRWVLRDGATTVIDVSRSGVDTWLDDRVRPKWGIYRSLGDSSGSLQDCYLLLTNMRAYQWSGTTPPPSSNVYEAENAVVGQGVVESNHAGFTGTGFVNVANEVGSYVEFGVNAPTAGTATLTFRYANGTTAARPMDITVNGALVANDLSFIPTPAWDDWDTRTVVTSVRSGANTIRATSASAAGGPNLDNLEVQVTAAPPPAAEYQAESAVVSNGVVESNHTGFTGTGFVNYDNEIGSYVEFSVTVASAGSRSLTLRFSNGTTTNRPMTITVNGTAVATGLAFPSTSTWDAWAEATLTASLGSGMNTVRYTATTVNGGPNLDRLTIS